MSLITECTTALATVQKETFTTLGDPATMTNDQLADIVIDGVKKLRAHHYTPDRWNPAARVFLATEVFDGKELIVGMSAALASPSGTTHNAWCSHKVAVLPLGLSTGVWNSSEKVLLPDFDRPQMWRAIADAQAALFVNEGHPYYCNAGDAPAELIAYRNDPASGWTPTSKNGKPPRDNGLHKCSSRPRATNAAGLVFSHWYVGANPPKCKPAPPESPQAKSVEPEQIPEPASVPVTHYYAGKIGNGRRARTWCGATGWIGRSKACPPNTTRGLKSTTCAACLAAVEKYNHRNDGLATAKEQS